MIDKATVQKIKDTADIVEVVGDYVHLIRRGGNYMGLCPFHNERTPSFSVNRRKNFCYCFSCKKGGSPVNFIMEKEGLSYHEALLHLARRYGIKVEERELTDEERRRQSERESMLVANEWAMRLMEHDLTETDEGRDVGLSYLQGRGVTDEAIAAFHLGYALDRGSHLTGSALKAGYPLDVFKQLGLVGTSQQGRDYDRFRGRVIFPILNTSGKVIAFGGRDLKGGLAKYINSPESELYKKSNELYGIYQARSAIVREDKCFLVEGYMDVIGMWQSGMKNVVASSGTALTDGQIALIHRFTDNITLIYDGDAAGVKASLRGIDMLLSHKMNVKTLRLPPEDDPDSFARKNTPEEFRAYVAEHETDIIRYKAQVMLAEMKNDPQQRIAAINSVVESIAHIPDVVSRDVYIRECASLLGISEEAIAKAVAKAVAEVVEKRRRERMRREFPEAMQPTPVSAPGTDVAGVSGQPASAPALPHEVRQQPLAVGLRTQVFPLARAEQALMRYCVRYGYMPFCTSFPTSGGSFWSGRSMCWNSSARSWMWMVWNIPCRFMLKCRNCWSGCAEISPTRSRGNAPRPTRRRSGCAPKASAKSRPGISPSMRSGGRKNGSQPSSPDGARDGCPTSGRTGRDANCSATRMTKSGAKPPNSFANGTTSAISTAARLLPSVRRTDSKYSCPAP